MIVVEVYDNLSKQVIKSVQCLTIAEADQAVNDLHDEYEPHSHLFIRKESNRTSSVQDLRFGRFCCGCIGFTNRDQDKVIVVDHCNDSIDRITNPNIGAPNFVDYSEKHFETMSEEEMLSFWKNIRNVLDLGERFMQLKYILK